MEHLCRFGSQVEKRIGEHRGVLYFAWHRKSHSHNGNLQAWTEKWRVYADGAIGSNPLLTEINARREWIHNDLFLFLSFPADGKEHAEQQLLEHAYAWRSEWSGGFAATAGIEGEEPVGMILHAGAAVIESDGDDPIEEAVFKAVKKAIVQGDTPCALERSLKRKTLERFINEKSIYPVYQPIRSLNRDAVFGYEALTRCPDNDWFKGPLELFAFAEADGFGYALDRLAREKAIGVGNGLNSDQKLFINLMTQAVEDSGFTPGRTRTLLESYGLQPSNVVFEITERSSINDFAAVKKALGYYRSQGYQIAIDDVGAGYSSLQSIVELRPDFIKVDRSIIRHIDTDEMKEHTLYTLQQLADKMGISVIAEGIEREEELLKVSRMGIPYGQGYLLGRPSAMTVDRSI
ncbi:EAL domain-containing protein [Paenibacillus thailandensis]|uniref:EAL domain-containing protein n=1 Tax=Paenibacillus thailandensis TaxID=393250 RepID=A0ABW5R2S9_9BACL